MNHVLSALSRARFGLRRRLVLEVGLLLAMLALLQAVEPVSQTWIRDVVDQNVVDQQLSQFADEIVIQTLLCRRFEKDLLLNLSDQPVRRDYLARWNQATLELGQAIEGFSAAAVTEADRAQAAIWRRQSAHYRAVVLQTLAVLDTNGTITPSEANSILSPGKQSIRTLTDTAMGAEHTKDIAVRASSDALRSAAVSITRVVVLVMMAGLILYTVLAHRRDV